MSHETRELPVSDSEPAADGPTVTRPAEPPPPGHGPVPATGFELLGELGRGGMGVVYRARDRALDREVAVKILQEQYDPASGTAARFVDEARITGQLQHPGIPAVYQVGTWADGRPFLAMKLIKGRDLDDLLGADGPHPTRWLGEFEHICQALGYAHARGVIHRDLKPQNVMVGAFGEVQVMDWGLAKVLGTPERERPASAERTAVSEIRSLRESDGSFTQAGSVLGTPAYMPPEQAAGELDKVDCRSDVFGLGAILCALLTGQAPYTGRDAQETRVKAVRGATEEAFARLDGCGADPDLVALCKRCLAFAPADRPADANAVAARLAELRTAAAERAQRAERDRHAAAVRATEQARRRRALLWSAAAVIAVLAAGVVASLLQTKRAWEAEAATAAQLVKTQEAEEAVRVRAAELDATLRLIDRVNVRRGQSEKAVEFYQRLIGIRRRAAEENPTDLEARANLAEAHRSLAMTYEDLQQWGPAREEYGKACELYESLMAAKPEDFFYPVDLASCYTSLASALWERDEEKTAAIAYRRRSVVVYDRFIATKPDDRWELHALISRGYEYLTLGEWLQQTGKPNEAREALRAGLSDGLKVREKDPTQAGGLIPSAHKKFGHLARDRGELKAAQESFQTAIDDLKREGVKYLARAEYEGLLAECHELLAGVSLDLKESAAAVRGYRECVTIWRRALEAKPKDADARTALVKALERLAGAAYEARDYKLSVESYEQSLEATTGLDRLEDRGINVEHLRNMLANSRAQLDKIAPPPRPKPEK